MTDFKLEDKIHFRLVEKNVFNQSIVTTTRYSRYFCYNNMFDNYELYFQILIMGNI